MSGAGSIARSAVSRSVSVVPTRRVLPPGSISSSCAVLTRLPLWPTATVRLGAHAQRRLAVLPDRRAGRRVAAVRDRQVAAQRLEPALVEHLVDQAEVLVDHHATAVADADAGRFLPAMLQREQRQRRETRPRPGREHECRRRRTSLSHLAHRRVAAPASTRDAARRSSTSSSSATPAPRSSAAPVAPTPTSRMRSRSPPTTPSRRAATRRLEARRASAFQSALVDGHDRPARALAEKRHGRRERDLELQIGAQTRPDRAFGDGHGEAARADVLRRLEQVIGGRRRAGPPAARLRGRGRATAADRRAPRRRAARTQSRPCPAQISPSSTTMSPSSRTAAERRSSMSSSRPTTPICAVGSDAAERRLVVQADVAAGDRDAECGRRLGQAADRLGQLPVRLGHVRVAEVEAVGEPERPSAGDADVARALGHGQRRAERRVVMSDTRPASPWR